MEFSVSYIGSLANITAAVDSNGDISAAHKAALLAYLVLNTQDNPYYVYFLKADGYIIQDTDENNNPIGDERRFFSVRLDLLGAPSIV